MVHLYETENINDIYRLERLMFIPVTVTDFKSLGFKQCYRCQRFNHSSLNCTLQPRCLKCAGAHITRDCTKSRDTPATCANCRGPHPANFRMCPGNPANKNANRRNQPTLTPSVSQPGSAVPNISASHPLAKVPAVNPWEQRIATSSTPPVPSSSEAVANSSAVTPPSCPDPPCLESTVDFPPLASSAPQLPSGSAPAPIDTSSPTSTQLASTASLPRQSGITLLPQGSSDPQSTPSSLLKDFYDLIAEIKSLFSGFDLSGFLKLFASLNVELSKHSSPVDKLIAMFGIITKHFDQTPAPNGK